MAKGLQHGGRRVKGKVWDIEKGIWVCGKKETKKKVALNKKIAIPSTPVASVGKPGKWICHRCTVHNKQSITRCPCCGARKPRISSAEHNASASPTNKNKISAKNGKGKRVMEKPHFQSSGKQSSNSHVESKKLDDTGSIDV